MLYFESGDVSNARYYTTLQEYPQVADNYLRLFFAGKLHIMDALEYIFTDTNLGDAGVYDKYMITLTLADEMPERLTYQEVFPYFFALQVNHYNALGETDGKIESRYLAGRIGYTCNWNFREYSGYNTLQNFTISYITLKVKFDFLLNDIYFELPIVQVEKGLFNTNFRKKNIGFMFNPAMESPGYFVIANNHNLAKYKLPKSLYMELFKDAHYKEMSYVFAPNTDLSACVDRNNHTVVQQMLYDSGFFAVCHFGIESNNFKLDDDSVFLLEAREPVPIYPEESSAVWDELRPHLYGLHYKHKFYVTYLYGSEVYIMCN